ncbi:hypothetical protein SEA_PATIO_25 [Gordonia phage Patio]|uniref:Uncharacterized protein n=2 Tax=Skysandvirus TaxID=2948912 RepID=A0A2D2W4I5_9CAUD|nr:hypothetical protein KNT76_gp25 [Gordonia phage Patio]YP_010103134.1 hypothetical protein KNU64_gp27 [Gordonia Phage Lollipop1437]ATS93107.1 hypothetical protein SEA_PATIO_25 [Gordonia phage Patio]QDF19131.1 hypothetical protein SEA_LOLLIPOP1437_27 [Gordonia Phage Lollipop1437]QRI45264.1 hypothetical protein SEA_ENNEA_28 [Gordonia phage Ennea]
MKRSTRPDGLLEWFTVHSPRAEFEDGWVLPQHWFRVNLYETTAHLREYRRRMVANITGEKNAGAGVIWHRDEIPPNGFLGTLIVTQDWLSDRVLIHESVHLATRALKGHIGSQRPTLSNGVVGVRNEEVLAYLTDGIATALMKELKPFYSAEEPK